MSVENAFKTVLNRYMDAEPAVFILFDDQEKPMMVLEHGSVADQLKTAANGIDNLAQLEEAAARMGGSFKVIPLSDLDRSGYLGAVFLSRDISEKRMMERLFELHGMLKLSVRAGEEIDRYHLLYQVTKKLHSTMDVHGVLREILFALNEFYPSFECRLLLSHDSGQETDLPIAHLQYGQKTADGPASRAYLTGSLQSDLVEDKQTVLYVPLKGKQGVYGVLQVTVPHTSKVPEPDVELIELLAGTGGNALENAQLYQQSQQFISDLQLINQTSRQLNANLRLADTINFMTEQITRSFRADEVGFIFFRPDDEIEILEGSTDYFFEKQSRLLIKFVSERLKTVRDPLFIGDLEGELSDISVPYRSFMGVPMIQNRELEGTVIVLNRLPYHFSFDEFKLLQSLVHHSTLAFTNSILHEKLEKMVITDYLTGLYARHYLDEQIQLAMNRDGFGCFVLLDIDDFKAINDTHGHQIGDEVLVQVAEIIRNNIRGVDIAARWGGEELAVYLPKVSCELGAQIGKRLVSKISEGTTPKTTVSCGISYWSRKNAETSPRALFSRADGALYKAKGAGKNQVVVFPNMIRETEEF